MRKNYILGKGLLVAMFLFAVMCFSAGQVMAQCVVPDTDGGVVAERVPGNPALCAEGLRIEDDPVEGQSYALKTGSITFTYSWVGDCGPYISWQTSGATVYQLVVKAGSFAHVYDYPDGATSDANLVPPLNENNGKFYGISHVDICFEEGGAGCPVLDLVCADDYPAESCKTQDAIDAAFLEWLEIFSVNVTNPNPDHPASIDVLVDGEDFWSGNWYEGFKLTDIEGWVMPEACGGSVNVKVRVGDVCGELILEKWCEATFTIDGPEDILIFAEDKTVDACLTQAEIDEVFDAWLDAVYATGGCGEITILNDAGDAPDKCGGYVEVTFTASSYCKTAEPVTVKFTVPDNQIPVITTEAKDAYLGCNPKVTPPEFKVTDDCDKDPVAKVDTDGPFKNGCKVEQTWTATYTDACGEEADPVSITYTWEEVTEPVLAGVPNDTYLGCYNLENENDEELLKKLRCDYYDVTAYNECGPVEVKCSRSGIFEDGCKRWKIFTFTATACDLTTTKEVEISWKFDTEAPKINCPTEQPISLGCNPAMLPNKDDVLDLVGEITDNCGTPKVMVDELTEKVECVWTRTFTITADDECGNVSTCEVVYTWTEDEYGKCETAFAKGSGALDFCSNGFNRWGWTNLVKPGSTEEMDLWAGAGQCDITKGTKAGKVVVTYSGTKITVKYELDKFGASEVQIYVGKAKFPSLVQGKKSTPTVAPGQYTYVSGMLDHVTCVEKTFTVDGTSDYYVIAHAVACVEICNCVEADEPDCIDLNTKSGIIAVKPAVDGSLDFAGEALKVYPNPFSDKLNFEFVSDRNARAVIEIFNMTGQSVTRLFDQQVQEGVMNRVEYAPTSIISGVYMYKLTIDGNTSVGRVIYRK